MSTPPSLEEIAKELALLARTKGCRGVIVAVSRDTPDGNHSTYFVQTAGPCLEVEGLQNRIEEHVPALWDGKKFNRVAATTTPPATGTGN